MLDSVKVQELKGLDSDTEENKMLRGIHKLRGIKPFLLEPYVNSINIYANCSGSITKPEAQTLPRLPVPKLEDTINKYLLTVRPFLNDEEFANTTALAKDFAQGLGKQLQTVLEKRAEKHVNWLEEWWLNTAYLEYRDPVVIYSSPGLLLPYKKFLNQEEQLLCAAKMLIAAVDYKILIDTDKIPLEKMGKSPLDMGQYKKIFGTCRIPAEKRDKLSFTSDSRHITVIHNNHIFHVDLWGKDNVRLNEDQLIKQLKTVIDLSVKPNNQGIGILTSENRDTWAKAYNLLAKDEKNREALADIATSIVVLCLDNPCDISKVNNDEGRRTIGGEQTIHGGGSKSNGGNRWYDKTIQFLIGADGLRGITYEHSPAEGQPVAILMDALVKYIDQPKTNGPASDSPVLPKLLEFNIDQDVAQMINQAKTNLDILVDSLDLCCFQYKNYGKNFIKSQKLSPDSYLQMAMQLAFYRLHKTPGAHYESAATRMYAGGRTETIRSCSIESVEFAQTMLNPQSTPKDKVNSLKKAIDGHKKYTVQALQGLGVDRHLLGLKLAAIENGTNIHKLYSDAGYTRSAHMRISTSQVALKSDGFMCYGPLVPDGYSTCYNPRDDVVNFATAAFKGPGLKGTVQVTSCGRYKDALEQSLNDMHDVLLLNTPSKL